MNYKRAAFIGWGIVLAGTLLFAGKRLYYLQPAPVDYGDLMNRDKSQIFDYLPVDSGDVVFIGDSQTERFPLQEEFNNPYIRNRGIGFNRSAHVLAVCRVFCVGARGRYSCR